MSLPVASSTRKSAYLYVPRLPSAYFFALLSLVVVAGCAGYAAFVLHTITGGSELNALHNVYTYDWDLPGDTTAKFGRVRTLLGAVAAGAGLLIALLAVRPLGQGELVRLGREGVGAVRELLRSWRALAPRHRLLAGVVLLVLTALRMYYSCLVQPYDDATSYELFVRERLLIVSAVYSLPNNHVLSNTLAWGFYRLYPGFWWSMRLPVLLTSTIATVLWFFVLLRRSNFLVALLAVALFGLLNTSIYYAATGRGYWLLVLLGAIGFDAVLTLQEATITGRARLAWVGLVLSGVLGLYTVPTHAFFLTSAYSWLALRAVQQRARRRLLLLLALGCLTLLGAGLLYAPLLLLSGPSSLFNNSYVQALPVAEFWRTLPEAILVPHRLLGIPLVLAIIVAFGLIRRRAQAGRLPTPLAQLLRQLGTPSIWFIGLPYVLAVLLLVQPPERTFFYKAQYLFIVVGLLADWAVGQATAPGRRQGLQWVLVGGALVFAASQVWQVQRQENLWWQGWRWQLGAPVLKWLANQPVGPVLAPESAHYMLLRFYAHCAYRDRFWQIDNQPRPGVHYRYLVSKPGSHQVLGRPLLSGAPTFHTTLMDIFVVP
jgi:hypothetical protein